MARDRAAVSFSPKDSDLIVSLVCLYIYSSLIINLKFFYLFIYVAPIGSLGEGEEELGELSCPFPEYLEKGA